MFKQLQAVQLTLGTVQPAEPFRTRIDLRSGSEVVVAGILLQGLQSSTVEFPYGHAFLLLFIARFCGRENLFSAQNEPCVKQLSGQLCGAEGRPLRPKITGYVLLDV